MVFEYQREKFLTDNDLQIVNLGRFPDVVIKDDELRKIFEESYGRSFFGADEIIPLRQALVARGMNFSSVEADVLKQIQDKGLTEFQESLFNKMASGIGRGHSMGGLAGCVLGLHGTKMLDSGLTGMAASRSLVTSGRRRAVNESDIVVPESLAQRPELLKEYLEITKAAFAESSQFKEKFGKTEGIEAFNKALAYNNPADLFWVVPLDTMATLAFEVEADKQNPRGPFLPKELHTLADKFPEIAAENGMANMYKQRIQVPRGTYFHYNVFKDPSNPNYPLELAQAAGMPSKPQLVDSYINATPGFNQQLHNLEKSLSEARGITDPEELAKAAIKCMLDSREFTSEYNEAVRATIMDSLSFRVWSEQKRHATLRQNVESIYSAAQRASEGIKEIWPEIQAAYQTQDGRALPIEKLEKIIVIDPKLKRNPELLNAYAYHSGRQLMFFDKLNQEGFSMRDAAFTIPRNTLTRNLENYDLTNIIDLELPLRLCKECEPERHRTSWQKKKLIVDAMPILAGVVQPKCGVGYCTERDYCGHIDALRKYDQGLHETTKEAMLSKAK